MKFFLDTAAVDEIKKVAELGFLDGVTTNPSLVMKSGRKHKEVIEEITKICDGPVSVEGTADKYEDYIKEAEEFSKWGSNIVYKVPMTKEGLRAVRALSKKEIPTNVTLVFSPSQALLAAKAGATYVSPFVGRIDDVSENGMGVVSDIVNIYDNYRFETQVIVASVRNPLHVVEAALAGADICTIPYAVFEKLWDHPLTDKGIATFKEHYEKSK